MICVMHGYLLDGSGSNLWTRSVIRALCREGETVHLVCQEPHPDRYEFIAAAYEYEPDGTRTTLLERDVELPGRCIMHKPLLGETLPVYVWDEYEEYARVVPMTELDCPSLEDYLHNNVETVLRVIEEYPITVLHANHAVLMSVVAQRASTWTGLPFVVMPHGSALEYAVRADERFRRLGTGAFARARRIIVTSGELEARVESLFGDVVPDLHERMFTLDIGVDTREFRPREPHERADAIAQVKRLVADLQRGDENDKMPDPQLEARLDSIDWETDSILAFVGRVIPAKGIHAVMAALPLLLRDVPRLRLLVVGHGPLRVPLEQLLTAMTAGDRSAGEAALRAAEAIDAGEPEHLAAIRHFWRDLDDAGELDAYWDAAARYLKPDTVVFAGYLTHREMSVLLPCCDAAIFPSMVVESGPLVFLEALASGVFPLGTYWGGTRVKIDTTAQYLPEDDAAAMRVRPEKEHVIGDVARNVPRALALAGVHRATLRRVAEERYDWRPIARRLHGELISVSEGS